MTPVERKSSIRKAPQADVVEALTQQSADAAGAGGGGVAFLHTQSKSLEPAPIVYETRPGPGRPRSKRRMEPFSSKIEISLRDELDRYLNERGMTVVAFLDEAIRDRLLKE
ncbi:hypothetical protein SAMN04489740_4370 [Arthrobacter alpinus]|uniref:Uncharacterized protein n=1 Tax=Arthrobacter alpinus TaxID=656366 RepID=A0A1H5PHQ6_9MICC|nr:hypothetical protein SAMN04489740_4370 [Arthrobacter alpinus]